jgi:LmbE family N-acetylglucosaminyl deacetylase
MHQLLRFLVRPAVRFVLAGIFVAVALVGYLEARRLGNLYWYDVTADQNYNFSDARAMPVALDEDGFDWPPEAGAAATALLAVDVRTALTGRWSEPAVEIQVGGGAVSVQYFERGASGRRYLNLGEVPEGTGRIGLRGRHLGWDDAPAELLIFESPAVEPGPVLILAPHPDDAEIAAFGLYSTTDSWVVTVSAGNNVDARMAHLEGDPAARSRLKGELRVWDSVTVPQWGGVPPERALNLGYFNQSLAALYREPRGIVADPVLESVDIRQFRFPESSPALAGLQPESSWASLVADLVSVIAFVQPSMIATPHPALDTSIDHKLTTVALIEALRISGANDVELLLYTNHATGSEYFPFGPAESLVSLAPWTGVPLELEGVLSVPLDADQRLRKLYALEAQHDLRSAPRVVGTSAARRVGSMFRRGLQGVLQDPTDTYSYMRRAPRPNELFLRLRSGGSQLLIDSVDEFLEEARAGRIRSGPY